MESDFKNRITQRELRFASPLVEDQCSEVGCGMTVLVDKSQKLAGKHVKCVACTMRSKIAAGEV